MTKRKQAIITWSSPSHIASIVQRPVRQVWRAVEALQLRPAALINGVAHFDRAAVERVEQFFEAYQDGESSR